MSANPRIRWEDGTLNIFEKISSEDYKTIKSHAQSNYAEVIKSVKNQLKNLLLFPYPAVLVQFSKILKTADNNFAISDSSGSMISLKHGSYCEDSFIALFDKLTQADAENNAMLLLFENDIEAGTLFAQPLALITDEKIVRLIY